MAIGIFFHQVVSIFDLPIHLVLIRLSILLGAILVSMQ